MSANKVLLMLHLQSIYEPTHNDIMQSSQLEGCVITSCHYVSVSVTTRLEYLYDNDFILV